MDAQQEGFACLFCARLFRRSDSLKRHWSTCKVRRMQALETPRVAPRTRGRKLRACDRCCRLKRACTSTDPCATCKQSCATCTYSRISASGAATSTPCKTSVSSQSVVGADETRRAADVGFEDTDSGTAAPDDLQPPPPPPPPPPPSSHTAEIRTCDASEASLGGLEGLADLGDLGGLDVLDGLEGLEGLGGLDTMEGANSFGPFADFSHVDDFTTESWDFFWDPKKEAALIEHQIRRPTEVDLAMICDFPFLEQFTRTSGFVDSFRCGSHEQRKAIMMAARQLATDKAWPQFRPTSANDVIHQWYGQQTAALMGASRAMSNIAAISASYNRQQLEAARSPAVNIYSSYPPIAAGNGATDLEALPPPGEQIDDDPDAGLLAKTHEIVSRIRGLPVSKRGTQQATGLAPPSGSSPAVNTPANATWSPSLEVLCYEFFRPASLQKFLALFWSFWYPNWPSIHRATFVPSEAPSSLLAAMAIVGACLAPDDRDRAMASLWFNSVEEMVFSDKTAMCEDPMVAWQTCTNTEQRRAQLHLLQAAFCVCLYQTWEGSKKSNRRIRQHRYNAVIGLAREIGFTSATLQVVSTASLAEFDWEEFILRESLIRTVTYIFNLDAAFALFYRYPTRMILSELHTDLAAPDTCFWAASAEECFVALKSWRSSLGVMGNMTIASAVKALCQGGMSQEVEQSFSRLSVLNMFTIVTALYAMTFKVETSLLLFPGEVALIQTGLQQWIRLWPSAYRDQELLEGQLDRALVNGGWKRVGFMRYAPEFCLVTYLILSRVRTREDEAAALANGKDMKCDEADMALMNSLITEFRCQRPIQTV